MIAKQLERINMAYAIRTAYSNEMYNTNMPFSEVYAEIRPPVQRFTPPPIHITNYDGGITNKNMEGSGGVLGNMMRHSVLKEDLPRHIGKGFADILRPPKRIQSTKLGKGRCCRRH
jgi:hypothetical protein